MTRLLLAVALSLTLLPSAMAAGSTSSSRPPRAEPGSYDRGVKAVKAGEYERALDLLQKVVRADPRNADAWNYIGLSQRKLRRFDQSLAAYQKALAIDPDHRGANEYLGELYLMTGEPEKARAQLAKLQNLCPRGCPEYDDLKEALEAYQSAGKKG